MVKRKDGRWQEAVTVEINGQRKVKYFYGKTKAEVTRKMAEWKAEEQEAAKGQTFGAVADAWWEEAEPKLAANSLKNYKPAYDRAVKKFGDRDVHGIRPCDVDDYLHTFCAEAGVAEKTAKTQLSVINLIFKYAVRKGAVDVNPCRDLAVPDGLGKTARKAAGKDQIRIIQQSAGAPFGMFAYWALYTGCRRGELLALTWEDVDIGKRAISVTKSLYYKDGKPTIKSTKTAAGARELPIFAALLEKLEPGNGPVFPGKGGGYMMESEFQAAWKRYKEQTGIEATPHQLRHTYATVLHGNGIDAKDAQYLLGHAQLSTTMDIYTEIEEEHRKKIRESLFSVKIKV